MVDLAWMLDYSGCEVRVNQKAYGKIAFFEPILSYADVPYSSLSNAGAFSHCVIYTDPS